MYSVAGGCKSLLFPPQLVNHLFVSSVLCVNFECTFDPTHSLSEHEYIDRNALM